MVQNKKRIISLILMLTLLVSSLVIGAITASAAEESVTISFASTAQRVSQTSAAQVWKNGDVTFTNNKESSTSNVANYSNPVRLYAGSNIVIDAPGKITEIEFTCNSNEYAAALKSSIGSEASVNGKVVTLTLATPAESYTITKLSAQVRLDSMTVYYEKPSDCEHENTTTESEAATCTTSGYETETCNDCGDVVSSTTFPALGHEYESDVCSRCGNIKPSTTTVKVIIGEYAEKNSWVNSTKYTSIKIDENITVTASGSTNTGKYYTSGPDWRIYQSESGTFQIKASNEVFIVSVKIDYNYSKGGQLTYNNSGYTKGSEIVIGKNSAIFGVANTGTATNGILEIKSIEVVYCDHNKAVTTSTATCTTSGKETVVCGCGYTTSKDVPATGHSEVSHNAQAPTCTDIGWNAYVTCGNCDYTTYVEIPALKHTGGTATCNAQAVCTRCSTAYGELNANNHASNDTYTLNDKAADCVNPGYTGDVYHRCCNVLKASGEEIKALGHDMTGGKNQLPTCTEAGFKVNECTRCDYEEKTTVEALGHAWVDATCAAPKTCANCGATEGTVKNHAWGEIIVVTLPTCTEKGTNKVVCGDCGAVSHLPVAALGHATEVEYWAYNNKLYLVPVCGCLTEKVLVDTTNALPVANEEDLEFLVTHGFNVFLDADINLTKTLDIEGAIVTIDLNGKTLKADWESDGVVEVIHVHDASHLTIVGDGNVISGGQYTAGTNSVISCRVYSMLTIKGGNYYSASYGDVIFCETSSIVRIEGGHFEAAKDYLGTWYILDIDETETYNRGQFVVTGGEFVNFNPANHTNDGSYTNKVVDGYHSINNNGIYTVGAHTYTSVVTAPTLYAQGYTTHTCVCGDYYIDTYVDAIPAEAQIGETKFETLQEALNAAVDGDTVVLLADIQVSKYLDVYTADNGATERKFTLDLNGKTISPAEGYNYNTGYPLVFVGINQTLTIVGEGTITADKKITVGVYGVLYLEGGKIVNNGKGEDDGAIHIYYWNHDLPSYEGIVGGTGYLNGGSVSGNIYCDDGDEKGEASLTVGNKFSKEPYALYKSADGSYVLISLMEAFKNAGENDTIALAQDVVLPEKYLMLEATLDLAGHRLHVAGLFNNGRVVDSALTGSLTVKDGGFTFDGIEYQDENGNQLQVPVCVARGDDSNTFVFRAPKAQNKDAVETEGKVVIDFRPSFAGGNYTNTDLFGDGSLDNDVKFEIRVTRTGADGTKTVQIRVSQELVKDVYSVTNRGIRLNITGAEEGYTYTIELVIYSCGVTVHNTELAVIPAAPATGDDDEQVNA